MKKIPFILTLLISVISITGCSNKFKYFGNTYPPTQNAKIYFREADIDKPYEVMGKMYCSFKEDTKDAKIQSKIMSAVKSHGGDGAVFGEMGSRVTGSRTSSGGGSTRVGKKKNASVGAGVSKTKDIQEDQMEIIVIKYKEAENP